MRTAVTFFVAALYVLEAAMATAQGLMGALIGTVKDAQGGVLPGAVVRVSSPVLIGGPETLTTNEKGQLRFPALPPGKYALDISDNHRRCRRLVRDRPGPCLWAR